MRSLTLKLALAFLIVSLTATVLVAVFAVWSTARQFNRFVDDQSREALVTRLSEYHRANSGWAGVTEAFPLLARDIPYFFRGDRLPVGPPPVGLENLPVALLNSQGDVVIGGLGYKDGQHISHDQYVKGVPIEVDGLEVGRLFLGG